MGYVTNGDVGNERVARIKETLGTSIKLQE